MIIFEESFERIFLSNILTETLYFTIIVNSKELKKKDELRTRYSLETR